MFSLKCKVCNVSLDLELPRKPFERQQLLFDLFSRIDEDGSGSVDRNEFLGFLRLMIENTSRKDADSIFDFLDADESGTVEFEEFLEWIEAIVTLFFTKYKRAPRPRLTRE